MIQLHIYESCEPLGTGSASDGDKRLNAYSKLY